MPIQQIISSYQPYSTSSVFLCKYSETRLALTSVLGPFGNSFYPSRCIDALFGVRIPFQSQVQSPEGNLDSSPPVQSPESRVQSPESRVQSMFTQVTERAWEIETRYDNV